MNLMKLRVPMRCFVGCILLPIFLLPDTVTITDGQSAYGTTVIFEHLKDEVIVAADSRALSGGKVHRDNVCKVATYRNSGIFAAARHSSASAQSTDGKSWVWDAFQTGRKALEYAESKKEQESKAVLAARFWGNRAKEFFQLALSSDDSKQFMDLIHTENNYGCIVEGVFVTKENEALDVIHVEVLLKTEGIGTPTIEVKIDPPTPVESGAVMGYNDIAREFLPVPTTERAKAEILRWKASLPPGLTDAQRKELLYVQIAQWTIDFKTTDKVGGDVNAAVLDQNGVRWLRQKEYCKAAQ
jgi:hypothetical protein